MRASVQPFEKELIAFLDSRKPPAKPGERGPLGIGNRNSADRAVIDAWLEDDRTEVIWESVKRKASNLSATEFIQAVLTAKRSARASVNRAFGVPGTLPGFNKEWSDLKKKMLSQLAGAAPSKLTAILEEAAREVRELHNFYFAHSDQVDPLSRQGPDDARARNAFFKIMSSFLRKHCGEQRYEEIALLSQIAFPGREVDPEDVRDALRRRTSPK